MTMAIKTVNVNGETRFKGVLLGGGGHLGLAETRVEAEAGVRRAFAQALQKHRRRTALLTHILREPPDPDCDGADAHDALMEFMIEMENEAYGLCADFVSLLDDVVDDLNGHYGVRVSFGGELYDPAEYDAASELLDAKDGAARTEAARAADAARPSAERKHQGKVTKIFDRAFREIDKARSSKVRAGAKAPAPVAG
jgi:hypothetical protein